MRRPDGGRAERPVDGGDGRSLAGSVTLVRTEEAPRRSSVELIEGDQPARPRSTRRSMAVHPGWIVVAGCAALLARATVRMGINTDTFWHLAAGRWMLAHHAVIRHDVFSYTVHGRPWLAEEWGFEVLLAWMVHHVGPVTYWVVSGGAVIAALAVSAARARLLGASVLWTGALSIPVAAGLVVGLAARPQDLSYLFFAVELLVLTLASRRRRALVVLPLLFLVWANVHGSFVAGLAVLGLQLLLSVGRRLAPAVAASRGPAGDPAPARLRMDRVLSIRHAFAVLAASLLATLVNPHGVRLLPYALHVATATPLDAIVEWQSPDFHNPLSLVAIALPMLASIAVLSVGRVRCELFDLVVFLALAAATLHAVRFAPYLVVAFAGMAAPWASRQGSIRRTVLTWPVAALACLAFVAGSHVPAGTPQRSDAPIAAARWLAQRPGRVFSSYVWDDYLIERGIPVFVDGRTDLYFGTGILADYEAITSLDRRPDALLRRFDVRWVLWPGHSALSSYLSVDRGWRLVRRFGQQEIFERA